MLATVPSAVLLGVQGEEVSVEVHVSGGLPSFTIVGHPDTSCREARDRVRAALLSTGSEWPARRITVNLAPSRFKKGGAGLDLAIAVGVLAANRAIATESLAGHGFLGELGLDGSIRPVPGALPLVDALRTRAVVLPAPSTAEARLLDRHELRPVAHLRQVLDALAGEAPWPEAPEPPLRVEASPAPDLADVVGQPVARAALEVAAAGGHHILLVGPPGSGKTMLASRLPGLLPPLDSDDALLATRVHSAAGEPVPGGGLVLAPPLRRPHHTATSVALVGGGGAYLRPGEISLAHGGVLFLDEMGEFPPVALDALRQPLEEGVVRISRAAATVTFPARFLLVGAMNPCPCGATRGPSSCRCSDRARARYARRLSGPLVDRFDLCIDVPRPSAGALLDGTRGESSAEVRRRVARVRQLSADRGVRSNAALPPDRLDEVAPLDVAARALLVGEVSDGRLSARGLHRVRCVARTVADLRGETGGLTAEHVRAALLLRTLPTVLDQARGPG